RDGESVRARDAGEGRHPRRGDARGEGADAEGTMTEATLPDEAAAFLRNVLGESWSEDWTVEPLAGDASVRAYYRIRRSDGSTLMLTWYPAEVRSQLGRFLLAYEAVSP